MKKIIPALVIVCLAWASAAQDLQHEVTTLNIEVPVRVFQGDTFVSDLTLEDFEIFEDGKPQKIEAVYLIKKAAIERKEEIKQFSPQTARHFFLFFEITEFNAKLEDAVDYFLKNVFIPGDELTIVTPRKTYRMKDETIQKLPREVVVRQLKEKIREDSWIGNSEYRNAMQDLEGLVRSLSGSLRGGMDVEETSGAAYQGMELDEKIQFLAPLMSSLENLRRIEQKKLLDFAEYLKHKSGQKTVFLFYQREFLPKLEPRTLQALIEANQDAPHIEATLYSYMEIYRRDITFDVEKVKQAFADSSIGIHFLYFTQPAETIPGIYMQEQSEDIYSAFTEMAQATGGLTTSSSNPEFLFQKASDASENYYLLYYTPQDYKTDGKFKNIQVKIKGRS
jgi:VWFA-related protein